MGALRIIKENIDSGSIAYPEPFSLKVETETISQK